ncbi:alpha/beta hydrolase [Streptomyces regalis]|uniref:Hydrolase superfamily dihydrolipoamide acyltransferase-like protein n=1 Tax=Streptomyces regalis TaxID=68262 RepID=A0A101JBF2_9ACTN|nr:alpha/beta hydrolase [Streptomyces regalis]KUL23661.1 hydrolase superfamily dihydrolipoamide acyltransferase-like protein [Streptomyces regalis]
MNVIAELKNFVVAHTRSQGLPPEHYDPLLARIRHDEDGTPGSWVREWSDEAARLEGAGRLLEACVHYNMARFPFVDGGARQEALDRCVATFDGWRSGFPAIERLDVDLPEGRIRCWTSGLDAATPRPLLVMTGGIVSVKEQWAPVLLQLAELGFAGVVTEMPGVGENTLPYRADSPRMYSALLDAVGERADTSRAFVLALSFSGHLALRAALHDTRIRGVVGAGAPIHDFFTDTEWQRSVPRVTTDTLAHLTGSTPAEVYGVIKEWALDPEELSALRVPVAHVTSLRDEIIPPGDAVLLRERVHRVRLLAHDDVHGSPRFFAQTRLWTLLSVLRMRGGYAEQRTALTREFARLRYSGVGA